jgi:hypothetical protein
VICKANLAPAIVASREDGIGSSRQSQLAFASDAFVLFRNVLDAVARISGIIVGCGQQTANFVFPDGCGPEHARSEGDGLAYCEFMRHDLSLLNFQLGFSARVAGVAHLRVFEIGLLLIEHIDR